jgi:hypothetical protein
MTDHLGGAVVDDESASDPHEGLEFDYPTVEGWTPSRRLDEYHRIQSLWSEHECCEWTCHRAQALQQAEVMLAGVIIHQDLTRAAANDPGASG